MMKGREMSDKPSEDRDQDHKKSIPFFPDYLLDEVIAWYVGLALLVILASLFPAGLEDKAEPLKTPAHIKPEWYFLFLFQFLKLVPRTVGVLAPGVGVLLLFLVPFLDRSASRSPRARLVPIGIALVISGAIIYLTVWAALS